MIGSLVRWAAVAVVAVFAVSVGAVATDNPDDPARCGDEPPPTLSVRLDRAAAALGRAVTFQGDPTIVVDAWEKVGRLVGILGRAAGGDSIVIENPACADDCKGLGSLDRFSAENKSIARIAVREGRKMGVPYRGWVVILTAGWQESRIRNLNYGDRDSLGWLQQRPSAGWKNVRDVAYASRSFYQHLQRVRGWEKLPVGVAAQRVQISAFPGLYAQWEDEARALLAAVSTAGDDQAGDDCTGDPDLARPEAPGEIPGSFNFGGQRTVNQAVGYLVAMADNRTPIPTNRCLRYVALAYGHNSTAAHRHSDGRLHWYAIDVWTYMPARFKHPGMSTPPRGALVFWRTGSSAGHIALSLGDGWVATTDYPKGRVGVTKIGNVDRWGTRVGWTAPYFEGRTRVR